MVDSGLQFFCLKTNFSFYQYYNSKEKNVITILPHLFLDGQKINKKSLLSLVLREFCGLKFYKIPVVKTKNFFR